MRSSAERLLQTFIQQEVTVMTIRDLMVVVALAGASNFVATSAWAHEEGEQKVKLEDVPAAARATIVREAKEAPILEVELEKEHGKTLFEAHVKQGSDVIGIVVDAKGTLIGKHSEKNEKEHEDHGGRIRLSRA
jgi:tRNA G10  N-methylase Trm11